MERVERRGDADVVVEIHRPLFAYVQSFVVADRHTSAVLGTGRVMAFDGESASSGLAAEIVQWGASARVVEASLKMP